MGLGLGLGQGQHVEEQQVEQRAHAGTPLRRARAARGLLRQPRRVERLHVREGVGHEAAQRVLPHGREGEVAQLLRWFEGGGVKAGDAARCVRRCSAGRGAAQRV